MTQFTFKKALCIDSIDDLKNLIDPEAQAAGPQGTVPTMIAHMYRRDFCDAPEQVDSGIVQFIPYLTFYHFNKDTSVFTFIKYDRPTSSGENKLKGNVSVGFGGHVDSSVYGEMIAEAAEDADKSTPLVSYEMTHHDLLSTLKATLTREVMEEIGFDLTTGKNIHDGFVSSHFFYNPSDENNGVGKVHIGYFVAYEVDTIEELNNIVHKATVQANEVEGMGTISICTSDVLPFASKISADVNFALGTLFRSMTKLQLEEVRAIGGIVDRVVGRAVDALIKDSSENIEPWTFAIMYNAITFTYSRLLQERFEFVYSEEIEKANKAAEAELIDRKEVRDLIEKIKTETEAEAEAAVDALVKTAANKVPVYTSEVIDVETVNETSAVEAEMTEEPSRGAAPEGGDEVVSAAETDLTASEETEDAVKAEDEDATRL